jgi:hypothetical protein
MLAADPRRAPGLALHGAYDPLLAAEDPGGDTGAAAAAGAAAAGAAGGSSDQLPTSSFDYGGSGPLRSKHDTTSSLHGVARLRSPLLGVHNVSPQPPPQQQQQQGHLHHHQAIVLHDEAVVGRDDEPSEKPRLRPRPRRRGLLADVGWVLRIPTFQAIVLQVREEARVSGDLWCRGHRLTTDDERVKCAMVNC